MRGSGGRGFEGDGSGSFAEEPLILEVTGYVVRGSAQKGAKYNVLIGFEDPNVSRS
jgi:hypothetical protein